MTKSQSKLTTQGQVSVPAAVRRLLHLAPGSVLEWTLEADRVIVQRAHRHTTAEVHQALFDEPPAPARTLSELKEGLRAQARRRHAGR